MIIEERPVGIDFELIKDKIERVARKFMSPAELTFIDQGKHTEHLYACWCAKEAIYKLQGKRNVSFLNNIHIAPFIYAGEGCIPVSLSSTDQDQQFVVHYEKFNDYMLGYAAQDN
jgi:phosphopantetheine--protein transferase-like protein